LNWKPPACLKGGKKFWALAKTGQDFALKGNDVTNGYILLATACDGTLATTAQFTSIRVVCNNTLAVALAGGCSAVKVPHNTTFDAQAVKKQLGISVSSGINFMYSMKTLSERKVKGKEAQNFFLRVFTDQGQSPVLDPTNVPCQKPWSCLKGEAVVRIWIQRREQHSVY
jgi:phage/plasmid-like protein (TIGR03299 family)